MDVLNIYDTVKIHSTTDIRLDGKSAIVMGFFGMEAAGPLGVIIMPSQRSKVMLPLW